MTPTANGGASRSLVIVNNGNRWIAAGRYVVNPTEGFQRFRARPIRSAEYWTSRRGPGASFLSRIRCPLTIG